MTLNSGRYADYHDLKIEVADKVATVSLHRPEARNAINQRLIRELRRIWDDIGDDPAVNVMLLTGSSSWFSVGGDVKAMSERPGGDVLEEGEVHDPMISRRLVTRQLELDSPSSARSMATASAWPPRTRCCATSP
jgi:enoyl-CoA hydratase